MQQFAGGVASSCAGLLVSQTGDGPLEHYARLGYVVAGTMMISVVLMGRVNGIVEGDAAKGGGVAVGEGGAA
jgi:hypothetical protein